MDMSHQPPAPEQEQLRQQVVKQISRIERADKERPTVLAQSAYIGVLGLIFVLPVVGGAYLGRWIDGLFEGYAMRWTLSLMLIGVVVGGVNVYFFIRE